MHFETKTKKYLNIFIEKSNKYMYVVVQLLLKRDITHDMSCDLNMIEITIENQIKDVALILL